MRTTGPLRELPMLPGRLTERRPGLNTCSEPLPPDATEATRERKS